MEPLTTRRELDAQIAEQVFGEKYDFCEEFDDYCRPDPDDPVAYDCCPDYSTDISAAWKVVERILSMTPQQDFHIEHWYHAEDESSGWQVSSCYELGEWKDWVQAEMLPLAVCLAALKAVRA